MSPASFSRLVIAGILLGGHWVPGMAEVYKWTDPQGRVHYGDRPPAGQDNGGADSVPITAAPSADPGSAARRERRQRLLDTLQTEREERQAQAAKEKAEREALQEKCAKARRQLEEYRRANVLYRKGKDGKREYLSDGDRDAAISGLRDAIARNCKGG